MRLPLIVFRDNNPRDRFANNFAYSILHFLPHFPEIETTQMWILTPYVLKHLYSKCREPGVRAR